MSAAAKLGTKQRLADFQHPNHVTILLIKQGYGTFFYSLFIWNLLIIYSSVLTNFLIDNMLHFLYFLRHHGNQMRKVKSKLVRCHQ